jgi:hypothetical protein
MLKWLGYVKGWKITEPKRELQSISGGGRRRGKPRKK